jgi:16S rRNA (guanine527-N7)-methyltransferase
VRLLIAWNERINLTAVRDPSAIALEHVIDSLTALPLLAGRVPRPLTLLDIGSGAGYPGLPLGLALRAERIVLVESVKKKVAFLEAAAAAAGDAPTTGESVPEILVVAERAEALARDPAYRGRVGLVTARAVAPLARLIPLALPFLVEGGLAVAWKRDDGTGSLGRELDAAAGALDAAGLDRSSIVVAEVGVEGLRDHRLVIIPAARGPGLRAPD